MTFLQTAVSFLQYDRKTVWFQKPNEIYNEKFVFIFKAQLKVTTDDNDYPGVTVVFSDKRNLSTKKVDGNRQLFQIKHIVIP